MAISHKLTDIQKKSLEVLKQRLDSRLLSYLNSCVRCGLCAESCHYFLAENNKNYIPGKKVEFISSIYKRYFTLSGKLFPHFIGARNYDEKAIAELTDIAFGSCTMCGRCTIHCSVGVDIALLVRTARSMLFILGLAPEGLKSTANAALNSGNNMNIPKDDFIDTLKWLEEDFQMEVND
jgi:Fe-S oxidoreductase